MNLQNEILIALSIFGLATFIMSTVCYINLRKFKNLAKSNSEQIKILEDSLDEQENELEMSKVKIESQSQLIASLKTKVQKPIETNKDLFDKATKKESFAIDLSQQKHKILSLAKNGNDSRSIAETLGIMPGEVELIVNLNRSQSTYV